MSFYKNIKQITVCCLLFTVCCALSIAQHPNSHILFSQPPPTILQKPLSAPQPPNQKSDNAPQPLQSPPPPQLEKFGKSLVYLENAATMDFDTTLSASVQVLRGDVRFRQDNVQLFCDSAYFYQEDNSVDAFSNVKMVQGDTLFLYGDMLFYDGNTKIARVYYNVRMVDRDVTLTTDSLLFDRNRNVGYYNAGGKIVDKSNTLTSLIGEYHPSERIALFKTAVKLVNPDFVLRSDTLRYNTVSKIANIVGPSHIVYKGKTTIKSSNGWYDTDKEYSQLFDRSIVYNTDGKFLTGDTIFYNRKDSIGIAMHNVVIRDTAQKVNLYGNYGYYNEKEHAGFVTQHAMLEQVSDTDTLYMHADTLATAKDSTYNIAKAYHGVRVFRSDFQAVCDSLFYSERDSVMRCFGNPVGWADEQQITGNEMYAYSKNKELDYIHVIRSAFASQQVDSIRFNQLSGKELKAYFAKRQIYKVFVSGNAESIFFPQDSKDSSLIGMNSTQSSFLTMYINNKKIDKVVLTPASNGTMTPIDLAKKDDMYLKNYTWQEELRPKDKDDIFRIIVRSKETTPSHQRHKIQSDKTPDNHAKK